MSEVLSFQNAILQLTDYWARAGCLLWQPYNTEVGAGTMNPATFLRVLGPEPWNVGYVEPSVRPDDSRYGDNPNRIQMHTQYQVILKPDPGNPQELYLKSLEALGIDCRKHDIRFVEDNWESPALGAWGLGWEVWLDGLEITQYTYFQQAGGFVLDPPSVEITYGLERILMALQGVDHFKKIHYAPGISYGELFGPNEYEMSVYNLDQADVARMTQLFDLYEAEALTLLEKGLPIPAYNYILKTSHTFNLLDSRGAIGVTERARYFARMRGLARKVAKAWLKRREELGFPLGQASPSTPNAGVHPVHSAHASPPSPRTFLLEIGSEEMPAGDVDLAIEQMRALAPAFLKDLRLKHGAVEVEAAPRRLSLIVRELAPIQWEEERVVKGPPTRVAFDAAGKPTKAAEGFAKKSGVAIESLERREMDGGEYLIAIIKETGRPATEVFAEALPGLIAKISFPKNMRWNGTNTAYSRPMRWIVALYGSEIVPFAYAGLTSGRRTRALRNAPEPEFDIPSADEYEALLARHGIMLRVAERRERIWARARELAREINGVIPDEARDGLLVEVANLVESPLVLRGRFEEKYLDLPREVLETVMRKHQRYFPVEDSAGRVLPYFIAAANGAIDADAVRAGNEAVLRARYADAEFFWKHDREKNLEDFRPALTGLAFQEKLGSMLEKNERLERIAEALAEMMGLSAEEKAVVKRAGRLAKADLMSHMVIELTSLAGLMGREYARRGGEPPEVAEAIFECTLPRFAGDKFPASKPGIVLSLADRLDSLVGLFAVGLAPTSAADPFALRRAALGVVQTLVERGMELDLRRALQAAAEVQPVDVAPQVVQDALDFVERRMEQWLLERGERFDLVQAVLAARGHDPALAERTLRDLSEAAQTEAFTTALTAYSRPARIVRGQDIAGAVDPARFEQDEERALWAAWETAQGKVNPAMGVGEFLRAFEPLIAPINKFFDEVFVMVDDAAARNNRLALLRAIADLSKGIVDLTKVQGF